MPETRFLTPEEVSERYRGGVSVGTLRNWRAMKIGPSFVKIGKAVLYPIEELAAWNERNKVRCQASRRSNERVGDQTLRSRESIPDMPHTPAPAADEI
jgi:hypothetical protein